MIKSQKISVSSEFSDPTSSNLRSSKENKSGIIESSTIEEQRYVFSDNQKKVNQVQNQIINQQSSNSSDNEPKSDQKPKCHRKQSQQIQLINMSQFQNLEKLNSWKSINYIQYTYNQDPKNYFTPQKGVQKLKKVLSYSAGTNYQQSKKKTILEQKQAEEDCKILNNNNVWSRTRLIVSEDRFSCIEHSYSISQITKIKIIPSRNSSKTKPQNIIKIQTNDNIIFFSLTLDKKSYDFPAAYYVFSKLITKKLILEQAKMYGQWQKSEHVSKKFTEDSYIYGNILKKSQHLGKWQQRFVVIRKEGVYSYRDSKQQESYSFQISSSSIKYIWTRFEFVGHYLIIKIKHAFFKTQFAIPLINFSMRTLNNWLYSFYRIMPVLQTNTSFLDI